MTNNSDVPETPYATITLIVDPHRVSEQDATELYNKLTQLAPTTRELPPRGAGANPLPDIWVEFIVVSAASGVIGGLTWDSIKHIVHQLAHMLDEHATAHKRQASRTGITFPYELDTNHNVTITISTLALLPEQLMQAPDWLAALPNHLHQPPLVGHTIEYVTVPTGYEVPIRYEDATDPLRYCTIQSSTMPGGIAVFDTHTSTLIAPYAAHTTAQRQERSTVISALKRWWRSRRHGR